MLNLTSKIEQVPSTANYHLVNDDYYDVDVDSPLYNDSEILAKAYNLIRYHHMMKHDIENYLHYSIKYAQAAIKANWIFLAAETTPDIINKIKKLKKGNDEFRQEDEDLEDEFGMKIELPPVYKPSAYQTAVAYFLDAQTKFYIGDMEASYESFTKVLESLFVNKNFKNNHYGNHKSPALSKTELFDPLLAQRTRKNSVTGASNRKSTMVNSNKIGSSKSISSEKIADGNTSQRNSASNCDIFQHLDINGNPLTPAELAITLSFDKMSEKTKSSKIKKNQNSYNCFTCQMLLNEFDHVYLLAKTLSFLFQIEHDRHFVNPHMGHPYTGAQKYKKNCHALIQARLNVSEFYANKMVELIENYINNCIRS